MRNAAFENLVAQALAVRIEDEIDRRGIKLRGEKHPSGPCPICGEGTDRFWINVRKQYFGCRICGAAGDVINLVKALDGVNFKTAVKTLTRDGPRPAPAAIKPINGGKDEKSEYALHIWRNAKTAAGTLVEVYLRSRAITIPPPPSLQFAPTLKHRSETGTVTYWPAMVALVQRADGAPIAVHRTYLSPAGSKAPVDRVKKALGSVSGGAVRLVDTDNSVMVSEGIETGLAVMQATGMPAWAALSAPGLRSLDLPDAIRQVTILADADDDGAGKAAAVNAGTRWKREGRAVRIARPPPGKDFNDLLLEEEAAS